MAAKQHKEITDAQLKKKFRSKAVPKKRFCYSGGGTVYLLDGVCNISNCNKRGTVNCLEGTKSTTEVDENE